MKRYKNIIILSDGSITHSFNRGILCKQSKILFCKIDHQNFKFNKKEGKHFFEFSKSSKKSKKYFK